MSKRRVSVWKIINCHCGRKLKIIKPIWAKKEGYWKSHIHCSPCNLEWHLNLEGRIYSHIWKINGVDVHTLKRREQYERTRTI